MLPTEMYIDRTLPEAIWKQVTIAFKYSALESVIALLCILETTHDIYKIIFFKKIKEKREKPKFEY